MTRGQAHNTYSVSVTHSCGFDFFHFLITFSASGKTLTSYMLQRFEILVNIFVSLQ